jgi:hypothetical protein
MTQTIEYIVKVNASAAQAAIADVEKRFGGVDTVVARLDKNLINLERDIKDLNAAIAAGGPNVEHYKKELEGLQAAAAGAVGAKSGSRAGGLLQLSQTVDDLQYGIRGVVNNIPGLVQGFGMSAGIAGGAQLAFIAVNQLTDKLTNYIKKQQEATQAAIKFRNSMMDIQIAAMQETADLQKRLEELNLEIGGGKASTAKAEADRQIKEIDERISNLDQQRSKRQGTVAMLERLQFRSGEQDKQIAYEKAQITSINTRLETERALKDEVRKQLEIKQQILKAEEKLANMGKKGPAGPAETRDYSLTMEEQAMYGTGFKGSSLMAAILESAAKLNEEQAKQDAESREIWITAESNVLNWLAKMREEAQDHRAKNELKAYNDRRRLAEKEKREQERDLEEQQRKWDEFYSGFGKLAGEGIGIAADVSSKFFDDLITGQEHATEMLGINFMSAAGEALVGHGVNLLGQSIVSAFTPGLQPLAAAQAGAGISLVGIGMGLGAGSTAAAHTLAGGKVGQALPEDEKSKKDRGASPRTSGGGTGGPLVLNVTYGVAGPLPEDTARAIHRELRSGDRRSGR